ncbi:MAG: TIGR04255 family protein [Methanosarcinales archaeon]|uniref:TIGR04255 family protein n=1 Tax=Candidatus Ethanoperedens thermophilum TaxID=2766897 RepID=A0A848D9F8_9EURY|nr:TIGR04255 family protein [Candidatus Ethanoperedens thermophilum]
MTERRYEKNFLSNVVFKLDFPTLSDYSLEKIKKFQELIKKEFQILKEKKGVRIQHKLKRTDLIETETTEIQKWGFFNKTKSRNVSFENNNIIVEFKEYTHSDEYFKTIDLVIKSLFQIFPSIVSTRLGLRYINQINLKEDNPFKWDNLLNESLLDSMKFIFDKKDMSRYITLIELNKEDYQVKFQYGIANSLYPSPIIKKEFVLDYDCFTYESLAKTEEIMGKVKDFNEVISDMFEESIGNGLRELMGVIEDE